MHLPLPTGEILAKHKTTLTSWAVTSVKVRNYFMYFSDFFAVPQALFNHSADRSVFEMALFHK